jgi:periplasmic nitrate reductase NapE
MQTSSGGQVSASSFGSNPGDGRRRQELVVFLVLTLLLAPVLAIATVGGYGLSVWVYQMIAGPPGPPAKAARDPGIVPKMKTQ